MNPAFKQKKSGNGNKHSHQVNIGEGLISDAWDHKEEFELFGQWFQQNLNYNSHGIKVNKWHPVDCSFPPPNQRPISPPPTPDWWPNMELVTRSPRCSFYKQVAMDIMIVMVMCLLLNSLQIDLVELFNNMRQDMYNALSITVWNKIMCAIVVTVTSANIDNKRWKWTDLRTFFATNICIQNFTIWVSLHKCLMESICFLYELLNAANGLDDSNWFKDQKACAEAAHLHHSTSPITQQTDWKDNDSVVHHVQPSSLEGQQPSMYQQTTLPIQTELPLTSVGQQLRGQNLSSSETLNAFNANSTD